MYSSALSRELNLQNRMQAAHVNGSSFKESSHLRVLRNLFKLMDRPDVLAFFRALSSSHKRFSARWRVNADSPSGAASRTTPLQPAAANHFGAQLPPVSPDGTQYPNQIENS
jgi:hypothetical protein